MTPLCRHRLWAVLLVGCLPLAHVLAGSSLRGEGCAQDVVPASYRDSAEKILHEALQNTNIGRLEYLCDTFGHREIGSESLEDAIDWIVESLKEDGLENVRKEKVDGITNWQRGDELASLAVGKRTQEMRILGLGNSIGTSKEGITAEFVVVSTFEELEQRASEVPGKIVVFNAPFHTYFDTVKYRGVGASYAAKHGAVAALIRSITPVSLQTPHTGGMWYDSSISDKKIPAAAITIEDAEMLSRIQARKQHAKVTLVMGASQGAPASSYNIVGEIVGSQHPEQVVVMGGHVDSWDVGAGAMDDGAGILASWQALRTIVSLVNAGRLPRPRRTVRVVMWVNEELGARGAEVYAETHKEELGNHILAIETDGGTYSPHGFGFTGTKEASCIMKGVGALLAPLNATAIIDGKGSTEDNGPLVEAGVPGASLVVDGFDAVGSDAQYFWYHHSAADTIDKLDYDGIRKCTGAMAVMSYVIADLERTLR